MTVGEAMERAEELRPGSRVAARTRQRWLCEVDGMLRERFFRPSGADSREGVGADLALGRRPAGRRCAAGAAAL